MEEANKIRIIGIVGPTGSGKTGLSIKLAQSLDGEIISCDSMQIYKGMDIGTAKVTKDEMQGIPHHMIDIIDPDVDYSVAEYCKECHRIIADIVKRGKTPIIVGGTGLYYDSVINNIQFVKTEIPEEIKTKVESYISDNTAYDMIKNMDETAAKEIHPNNIPRVKRALELMLASGKTMTQIKLESRKAGTPYRATTFFLTSKDRDYLYGRIEKRVDMMVDDGLVSEAKELYSRKLSKTAKNAIGYKEIFDSFENQTSLELGIESVKTVTRQYAKRQITWFNRNKEAHLLYVDEMNAEQMLSVALEIIKRKKI